ncbi:MAG: prepilin-type N-terminal cleavage/methylation domain-containing protein [Deltaproteobacteria bacterium]|nr:prepilin-type N-terminal cleavage/methylation domain-containing protein [Deltaproteobacteria bacterium]
MGQKGFTLIEVLASVAILGLGIIAVTRLFSGSLGLAKASSDSTSKVLFAKDKMNQVLLEDNIKEGTSSGASEGFSWVMAVKEFEGALPKGAPKVLMIDLSVSGSGAPLRITTLKTVLGKE